MVLSILANVSNKLELAYFSFFLVLVISEDLERIPSDPVPPLLAFSIAMATQQTRAFSFLKGHPKVSCLLLLLLTPPLLSIILYFTPLLLCTALCVFALISLSPYFTATDGEVERQSNKGASSGANVVESSKRARVEEATRDTITSTVFSSASENSWFSWMKGLNDVGRIWMESKLREEGLALSEPANRETLFALIQGSFAELVTAKGHPLELLSREDDEAEADGQTQEIQGGVANDASGDDVLVGDSLIKQACDEKACEMSLAHGSVDENYAVSDDFHRVDDAAKRSVKRAAGHECFSSSTADGPLRPPGLGSRNPSKSPASKLLEASRRIFTREDSKAMLFRAPSEAPPSKLLESSGSVSSKGESKTTVPGSGTPIKALSRKLLEGARSNASKEERSTSSKAGSKAAATAGSTAGTPIIMKGVFRKAPEPSRSIGSKEEESEDGSSSRTALEAPGRRLLEASRSIANKGDGAKYGGDVEVEEEMEEAAAAALKQRPPPRQDDLLASYKRTPSRARREGTVAASPATATTTTAAAAASRSSPLFPTFK